MGKTTVLALAAVALLGPVAAAVCAQEVQVFELGYALHPASGLSRFDGSLPLEGQDVQLGGLRATLSVPVVLAKDSSYLYNKLAYRTLDVGFDGAAPGRIERVHALKYELAFVQQLWPRWWLSSVGSVELASDFESVELGDLQTQGAVLLTRTIGAQKRLDAGGGVALTNSSGDPSLIPVLYLRHVGERHRLELVLPERASFYLMPSRAWRVGLAAEYDGNRFHVHPEDAEVRFSSIQVGPSARWRFTRAMSASLDAGVALERKFVGFLEPLAEHEDGKLETGLYVRTGVQLWVGNER